MPKRALAFVGSWIIATVLCILFVDRAASTWTHAVLRQAPVFDALTHIVDPLRTLAAIGLAASGVAALASGWRPGEAGRILIAACLSLIIAVALKDQLKYVFGRTWPETWVGNNPSWIMNGSYGFHYFHGGKGWTSFPSGHMAQISSVMAVLWWRIRRLRWVWATFVLLVAIGLFGADYHFVGDMVAGTYLGVATAAGVLALLERGGERWPQASQNEQRSVEGRKQKGRGAAC